MSNNSINQDDALKILIKNCLLPINDEIINKIININNRSILKNEIISQYKRKVLELDNNIKKYIPQICVNCMELYLIKSKSYNNYNINRYNNVGMQNLKLISTECDIIYHFFHALESDLTPISNGDYAQQISNLCFNTRI